MDDPFVSILLPVRGESDALVECLAALSRQTYAHDRFELLVADGSDAPLDPGILPAGIDAAIVRNHERVMSRGLNLLAGGARGDYLAIVSAHSAVPDDYLERMIETARATGAANVGSRIRKVARSPWGRAIAAATSSRLGVGGGVQHHAGEAGPADSAFPGFIERSAFDALAGFNPDLACNEDDEFNARLRAAGCRVWYDPSVEVVYRPRETPGGVFQQHFRYGRWKVAVARTGIPNYLRPRHFAPAAAVVAGIGMPIGALVRRRLAGPVLLGAAAYAAIVGLEAARIARRHDADPWRVALVFPLLHAGYGFGFLRGLLDRGFPDEGQGQPGTPRPGRGGAGPATPAGGGR